MGKLITGNFFALAAAAAEEANDFCPSSSTNRPTSHAKMF